MVPFLAALYVSLGIALWAWISGHKRALVLYDFFLLPSYVLIWPYLIAIFWFEEC